MNKTMRALYAKATTWVALNDDTEDGAEGMPTTLMISDLFSVSHEQVAREIDQKASEHWKSL